MFSPPLSEYPPIFDLPNLRMAARERFAGHSIYLFSSK